MLYLGVRSQKPNQLQEGLSPHCGLLTPSPWPPPSLFSSLMKGREHGHIPILVPKPHATGFIVTSCSSLSSAGGTRLPLNPTDSSLQVSFLPVAMDTAQPLHHLLSLGRASKWASTPIPFLTLFLPQRSEPKHSSLSPGPTGLLMAQRVLSQVTGSSDKVLSHLALTGHVTHPCHWRNRDQ